MASSAASGHEYDSVFDSYEGSTASSSLQLQAPAIINQNADAQRCYDDLRIAALQFEFLQGTNGTTVATQSPVANSPLQMKPLVSESPIGSAAFCKWSFPVHIYSHYSRVWFSSKPQYNKPAAVLCCKQCTAHTALWRSRFFRASKANR